jgi:hypothetical protein
MAGARGAAGPAQDVHHQPPGTTIMIYCNYGLDHMDAASKVVKAAQWYKLDPASRVVKAALWYMLDPEFEPHPRQLFVFVCYAHRHMNLFILCMYLIYTLYEQDLNKYVHLNNFVHLHKFL